VAATGRQLPSTRLISTQFTTEADVPSENYTLLVMQWGQFLDHDLTHTPISRGEFSWGSAFVYLSVAHFDISTYS
jgi:peroxidase